CSFSLTTRPPPSPSLFPYTTLFRSHGQMYRALIGHYMQDRSAASRGSHVECMNAGKLSCPKIYCRPGVSWCLPLKSLSIEAYCAPTPDRALITCFQIPSLLFFLLCLPTF